MRSLEAALCLLERSARLRCGLDDGVSQMRPVWGDDEVENS